MISMYISLIEYDTYNVFIFKLYYMPYGFTLNLDGSDTFWDSFKLNRINEKVCSIILFDPLNSQR